MPVGGLVYGDAGTWPSSQMPPAMPTSASCPADMYGHQVGATVVMPLCGLVEDSECWIFDDDAAFILARQEIHLIILMAIMKS
jgi:hypothetical protein